MTDSIDAVIPLYERFSRFALDECSDQFPVNVLDPRHFNLILAECLEHEVDIIDLESTASRIRDGLKGITQSSQFM